MEGFAAGLWKMVHSIQKIIRWAKNKTWEYLFEVLSKYHTAEETYGNDRFELRKSSYTRY